MSEFDASDAFAALRSRLADDWRPVRPYAPGRWLSLFLGLFAPLAALALWSTFGWRSDQATLGVPWLWGLSALELAAAFVLLAMVLREAVPARSPSLALLTSAAAGVALLHVAVTLATLARSRVEPAPGHEWPIGLYCFAFEIALAVPCVLFALWLGRRGLTTRPRRLGLLGGIGAGLAADAVWRLVCPYTEPAHAFGSHSSGIVTVAVAGLGLAAGWEALRARGWRAASAQV